jgi:hypothetical protein
LLSQLRRRFITNSLNPPNAFTDRADQLLWRTMRTVARFRQKTVGTLVPSRSISRWRAPGIAAALILGTVSILLAFTAITAKSHRRAAHVQAAPAITFANSQYPLLIASALDPDYLRARRTQFPYSVVPGGVASPQELWNAIENDSAVASHYAGFNLSAAHITILDADVQAYVSYRIGDGIFWTRKRLTLHKNEKLITDGNLSARARCGNRVSATAQLPVSEREPLPTELDADYTPAIADLPMDPGRFPILGELAPSADKFGTIATDPVGDPFVTTIPGAAIIPLKSNSLPPIAVLPSLPSATPEPGSGFFLLLALSLCWLWAKLSRDSA